MHCLFKLKTFGWSPIEKLYKKNIIKKESKGFYKPWRQRRICYNHTIPTPICKPNNCFEKKILKKFNIFQTDEKKQWRWLYQLFLVRKTVTNVLSKFYLLTLKAKYCPVSKQPGLAFCVEGSDIRQSHLSVKPFLLRVTRRLNMIPRAADKKM